MTEREKQKRFPADVTNEMGKQKELWRLPYHQQIERPVLGKREERDKGHGILKWGGAVWKGLGNSGAV